MNTQEQQATINRYLCIGCPMGCRLEVEEAQGEIVEIRGFSCKRGEEYAAQEHTHPKRMVTTTVGVENGLWRRLPVRTTGPIPKEKVLELCKILQNVTVSAPIAMGEVILPHALGTDVDIISSRDMPIPG